MSRFDPSLHIVRHPQERLLPSRSFVELIQAVLEKGADFRLRAKGMSMYPFIHDGDILTLRRLEKSVKPGRVLAFSHPETGNLVIHRLVEHREGFFLIKGDNIYIPDGWIPRERLLAQVIRVERDSKVVRQAHRLVRRLIVLAATAAGLRRFRYLIYKILSKLGEFY